MNFEAWKFSEKEKKLKKDQEKKELQQYLDKQKTHEVTKKQIETHMIAEQQLSDLKELVDNGIISQEQAEHIINHEELDSQDIKEIFDNIDKIEDIKDIDNYLPSDLRVSKDQYQQAMVNEIYRTQTLVKIKTALTILSQQTGVNNQWGVHLFSWFLWVLDQNLILIQEHNIDMKNSLETIHISENPHLKKWFWSDFFTTLKEIFK